MSIVMQDHEADPFTPSYWVQYPHRFSWRSLGQVIRRTYFSAIELDTSIRCAGVAFFSFLSLFPAVAAAVAIYALFADPRTINDQLVLISAVMPGDVVTLLRKQLDLLAARQLNLGFGLAISLLLTLWTGSRGVNALLHSITRAHMEPHERGFFHGAVLSIVFTIAAFTLMAVLTSAVAVVPIVVALLPFEKNSEILVLWLRWPVVGVLVFAAFVVLFTKAPYRRPPRTRWVVPGALLSTLLWIAGSILFSFYIENFANYNATFGSIAATAVLMLWLYVSAFVLVLGAIFNAQLEYQTGMDTTVGPAVPRGSRGAFVADNIAYKGRYPRPKKDFRPVDVVPMRPDADREEKL